MKIFIKLPATTANLGAGFDTFAVALKLYNEIYFEKNNKLEIIYSGEFAKEIKKPNVFEKILKENGIKGRIQVRVNIPVERGLGASATAVIGAIVLKNICAGERILRDKIFKEAKIYENHPDNLSACIYGGFCIVNGDDVIKIPVSGIEFIVVCPLEKLKTSLARKLLPKRIRLQDAVKNIQNASSFIYSILNGKYENLKKCMEDEIHEKYRKKFIKNYDRAKEFALKKGAYGFTISGAGTSVVALTGRNSKEILEGLKKILSTETGFILEASNNGFEYKVW